MNRQSHSHSPSPARLNAFSAYASGGKGVFGSSAVGGGVFGSTGSGGNVLSGAVGGAEVSSGGEEENGASGSGGEQNGFGLGGAGEEKEKKEKVSFGERLRAGKDEEDRADDGEDKVEFNEQEVLTGEEDEETVYQVRGKLFALSHGNQWKEKGTGMLKLNVRREDGSGARLVMRKEAVYTLLMNVMLFRGMKCFLAQDPRYLRFSVIEGSATTHYNLRVSNAKIAEELLEEINSYIPTE